MMEENPGDCRENRTQVTVTSQTKLVFLYLLDKGDTRLEWKILALFPFISLVFAASTRTEEETI